METAERYCGRVFLFVTGLLVLASLFSLRLALPTALATLVVGVVFLGLPHGALDSMVASKSFANNRYFSRIAFYASYLCLALSYSFLWSRYPTLGLSCFLAIAAIHFSSDWQDRGSDVTRLAYGVTIVTLPALAHPVEVAAIYAALGTTHAELLVNVSKVLAVAAVILVGTSGIMQFRRRSSDLYEFVAIIAGAMLLAPLVSFTCYFCLLHSPRHLLQTAEELDIAGFRSLFMAVAPVVLITVMLAGTFWFLMPGIPPTNRVLTLVFVGLASLTVPHMILDRLTEPTH